jgi:hypothetical protein
LSRKNNESLGPVSPEIEQVINDGQRLITYIARNGGAELAPEVTQIIIDAKYKLARDEWSAETETLFLLNYDKLAKIVYPVTIESINAVIPAQITKNSMPTKAASAVAWYRRYTLLALLLLLITQIYYLFGKELNDNLYKIFEHRNSVQIQIEEGIKSDIGKESLSGELAQLNQRLDANYKLLMLWNQVWSFGGNFNDSMPQYFQTEYEVQKRVMQRQPVINQDKLDSLELKRSLHQARIVYFGNVVSADTVLKVLQGYILPLMYGLLGAFIFVLRSLLEEIKAITYTLSCEIRYRLRLTLGALGGMIIGWFLKPEEANALASLSPMAMAFLMGYNVDVLFTLMDKIIDGIKQAIDKMGESKPTNRPAKV